MSQYYPVALDLRDRPCLVVGGGPVAESKVEGLLFAHARVTVVSPALTERLASWATEGRIAHRRREYIESDCEGQHLAFSATDRREVTEAVAADARRRGVWVNAADDPVYCDFLLPSVLRRGRLQVAVSETPVALIRWGTTEAQEVRVGTLADIASRAHGLDPPVVAVIGEVVRLRERLDWAAEAAAAVRAI